MSTPDHTSLLEMVKAQKALAQRNRSVRSWGMLVAILLGGLGWVLWYFAFPATPASLKIRIPLCFFFSFLGYYFWLTLYGKVFFPHKAACPQCGYSWEIKEGRGVHASEVMTNWDKCPGCGSLMTEALLKRQLASEEASKTKSESDSSLPSTRQGKQ